MPRPSCQIFRLCDSAKDAKKGYRILIQKQSSSVLSIIIIIVLYIVCSIRPGTMLYKYMFYLHLCLLKPFYIHKKIKACPRLCNKWRLKVGFKSWVSKFQIPYYFSVCLPLAAVAINTIYFSWLFLVQAIITDYHKLGDLLRNHEFISHSSGVWEA